MPKAFDVALQNIAFASGADGRSMRLDVKDQDGDEVRLYFDATTVPALVASLIVTANQTMASMPQAEMAQFMADELNRNIINPIQAHGAKAVCANDGTQLMLHLGTIVLQFRLPTAAASELAREVLAQAPGRG